MVRNAASDRVSELVKLLDGLCELQGQLIKLAGAKMEAMRRADVARLQELGVEECAITRRLQARDALRRDLMRGIEADMGLPGVDAGTVTVSRIVEHLPEPVRTQITDVATCLRHAVTQAAQANRVAGSVAREMVNHLHWVFSSVRPKSDQPIGYSHSGTKTGPSQTQIFETTG